MVVVRGGIRVEVLLRIEGVNFDATLYDTRDLSTVRGASFLYLDAISIISQALANLVASGQIVACRRLSAGGSVGLFQLTLDSGAASEAIRSGIEAWLGGRDVDPALPPALQNSDRTVLNRCRHLSFTVDIQPMDEKAALTPEDDPAQTFLRDRERVIAANRVRQMQAPSVVVPERQPEVDHPTEVCAFDLVRPARTDKEKIKRKKQWVSGSVLERRRYGQDSKKNWYERMLRPTEEDREVLELPQNYNGYAGDFEELADDEGQGRSLNGKIAVLYADGNSFSAIQDRLIRRSGSPLQQQWEFDARLHGYRRRLLHAILWTLAGHTAALTPGPGRKLRLETLYAAGDEGMWVVPASLGWTLASTFFAQVLGLDPSSGQPRAQPCWQIGDQPLHVAAGLVFCHHNAPITRIQRLARDLAELAKANDRGRSLLCYQVLESFDHIGRDLEGFRRERCPGGTMPSDFILPGDKFGPVAEAASAIKSSLPRRQLKRLALALHAEGAGARYARLVEQTMAEVASAGLDRPMAVLRACFGDGPALWLHLDDLWDFLGTPVKSEKATCAPGG